jgi:hypothetical protein
MWRQLRNPYPPPHSISFPHAIVLPVPSLSFLPFISSLCTPSHLNSCSISYLHGLGSPNLTLAPPSVSSLHIFGLLLNQFLLRCSSPLRAKVRFPPTQLSLPCPSSLRAWVGFPSTRFSLPCPSPLCAWVGLLSTRFSFTILCCKYLSVKLQHVHESHASRQDPISEIERSSNVLSLNFLLKFFYNKGSKGSAQLGCLVLLFWCPSAN